MRKLEENVEKEDENITKIFANEEKLSTNLGKEIENVYNNLNSEREKTSQLQSTLQKNINQMGVKMRENFEHIKKNSERIVEGTVNQETSGRKTEEAKDELFTLRSSLEMFQKEIEKRRKHEKSKQQTIQKEMKILGDKTSKSIESFRETLEELEKVKP